MKNTATACECGGRTNQCDGCPDCLSLGCDRRTWVVTYRGASDSFVLYFQGERIARREAEYLDRSGWGSVTCLPMDAPMVHSVGCACEDCSSAYEHERTDPRG